MRKNENLVRFCNTCEYYEVGCEEKCPFELRADTEEQPSLRTGRRNMKAEKAQAYEKAKQKLNSAENKAAQGKRYQKPKNNPSKNLDKEIERLEGEHEIKVGEPLEAYPKAVFQARAEAIKQAKRKAKRLKKQSKK